MSAYCIHNLPTVIECGQPRHLTTDQFTKHIASIAFTGNAISDAAAVTIASWWQGPGWNGDQFAMLASTGHAVISDLLDAIAMIRNLISGDDDGNDAALALLAQWAGRWTPSIHIECDCLAQLDAIHHS